MKNLYMPSASIELIISQASEEVSSTKTKRVKLIEIKDQDTSDQAFAKLVDQFYA